VVLLANLNKERRSVMTLAIARRLATLGAACVAVTLVSNAPLAQGHGGSHWSYSGASGPTHWADLDEAFATCRAGQTQSPIDVRGAKSVELPPIQFDYQPSPLHIVNNGHTIQVNYAPGSSITVGDQTYQLVQFHFHHPSEERVDGKRFDMVAHLVHATSSGAFAVVAVLFVTEEANQPFIASLWQHLPAQEGPEQKFDNAVIDVADLLPFEHGYYTFTGSLTTPPCTENVRWFVLKSPQLIAKSQADAFGKIYSSNARPLQPLNQREVLASK
jgi:carbonic anhydrase